MENDAQWEKFISKSLYSYMTRYEDSSRQNGYSHS